jgi:hypothetical protein
MVLGKQADTLKLLVTAASDWRTAAATQGVVLTQINASMSDGKSLALIWSEADKDWTIETGSSEDPRGRGTR